MITNDRQRAPRSATWAAAPNPVKLLECRRQLLRTFARRPAVTVGSALVLSQILVAVVGLVGARALGPSGKGQVTAVLTWTQILVFAFLLGLSLSLSVRTAESRGDELGTVLGNAVVFVAGVTLVLVGIASVVLSPALRDLGADTPRLLRWGMVGGGLTMGADLLGSVHMALGRHRRYAAFRLALPVTGVLVVVPLSIASRLTAGWVVASFIAGAVLSVAVVSRGLPWRSVRFDLSTLLSDVRYGLRAHVASLVGAANTRLDLLIMSLFLSATTVGLYGLANSLMVVLTAVPAAGGMLLMRSVAWESTQDPATEVVQLGCIRRAARKYLLLSAALGACLFFFAPLLVQLLLGPAYAPSVPLIQILIPGYVARAYLSLMTAGAVGLRRPWIGNTAEGVAFVVTAALLAVLLPRYGAMGAAITSTCAYIVAATVGWYALRTAERRVRR